MIQISRVMEYAIVASVMVQMSCKDSGTGPVDLDPPSPPPVQLAEWDLVGLEGEEVSAIAVVASKPWVMFAGTMSDFSAGTRGKIFRSNDWGRTWREVARDVSVTRIVVDPKDPFIVYAGLAWVNFTAPGVIKSTDGGYRWFKADAGMYFHESGIGALVIDPVNTNVLYAGKSGFFGGALYKTTNGGRSWFGIPDEQPYPLGEGVTALAIDPSNTKIIYAGTAWGGHLFKSTNEGSSWALTGFPHGSVLPYSIAVNQFFSNIVYVGGNFGYKPQWGFFKSTSSGSVWETYNDGLLDTASVARILVWSSSIIFLSANWRDVGGVYHSTNGGSSWRYIGIDSSRVGDIQADRVNGFLYVAKGGVYRRKIE
jgi:hypothetical protein